MHPAWLGSAALTDRTTVVIQCTEDPMGKHRKPSHHTTTTLAVLSSGAIPVVATGTAHAAPAWDELAACESSGDWHIDTGNGFFGGLQFTPGTWREFGGTRFAASAHEATRVQQIQIAERVLEVQGPGAWPGCTAKLGAWWDRAPAPTPLSPPGPAQPPQGWVWPVDCTFTSGYGPRAGGFHDGADFGCPVGTPFKAAAAGEILAAGPAQGYGVWVQQRTESGYLIEYGHLSDWHAVPGEWVAAGDVLGLTGNTGQSSGPHLHLRIHAPDGTPLDPVTFLNSVGAADTNPTPPPTPPPPSGAPDAAAAYTVVAGDTLSGIAAVHGTSWPQLAARNPHITDPDLIYPGDMLTL